MENIHNIPTADLSMKQNPGEFETPIKAAPGELTRNRKVMPT